MTDHPRARRRAAELHVRRDEVTSIKKIRTFNTQINKSITRAALGIDKSTDILDHIYELPSEEQDPAFEKIRAIERRAMASQKPQGGLVELMDYLDDRGVPKGICTRNFEYVV